MSQPADGVEIVRATVLDMLHDAHRVLRAVVAGLEPAALNWRPAADANSIAVLVNHALDAERFILNSALDRTIPRDRDATFRLVVSDADELLALIDQVEPEIDTLIAEVRFADLERHVVRTQTRTGAWWLLHAPEHTREHVGQALLTADLWRGGRGRD